MVIIILFFLWIILAIEMIRLDQAFRKGQKAESALIKREKELWYLYAITNSAVSENKPPSETFPRYLNTLRDTFSWAYASVFRLDEERQVMPIRFTGYLPDWYMKELSTTLLVRVGDACVGRAVATKQPAAINEAIADPRFQNLVSYSTRSGYRSLSCYPLMGKLKTHGGFCAYSMNARGVTLHDTQFLMTIANLYGAILENKLLQNFLDRETTGNYS